jgi:aminopeptidase-like protein
MTSISTLSTTETVALGEEMFGLMGRLFPICRSITGDGVRQTLKILQEYLPLEIHEVSTGTPVFDWTIPKEWNIRDAYIKNSRGEKIVDFQTCNLHVVSYSTPIRATLPLSELKKHIFTSPEHPHWVPYRTSYFKEDWGFCLRHSQLLELTDGDYEVVIDSSLTNGNLTYGELLVKGSSDQEVLVSAHICHPSLANDNLSGVVLSTFLARRLSELSPRYSYRFLFTPGTIGSITWLSLNESSVSRIRHGLILACAGDPGKVTYKKSRQESAEIDRAVRQVLKDSGDTSEIIEFSPYGYDERQFCSPGFDLPVGCFMRTPHGKFPEYHTSADNLDLVRAPHLSDSFSKCMSVFGVLERNRTYMNLNPKCEPQLGRRGLYSLVGGQTHEKVNELAMLWVLNLSDGKHSLLEITEKSGLPFNVVQNAADKLQKHNLLEDISLKVRGD